MNQFRRRFCRIVEPSLQVSESGDWSNWSDWSSCSSSCGIAGHQIRSRMCSNPVPSNRFCISITSSRQFHAIISTIKIRNYHFTSVLVQKVHTVLVRRSVSGLVYQKEPALGHQLTENGHHGLNGHNALILASMVIDPEQGNMEFKFCSNPRPSEGGFQCTGSDFEITSCDDISRCFHCSSLLQKMYPEKNNLKQS
uniref:Thrombospondin type 1 domain-containing protein n=1 Tax=Wuchereria bancrofti TaxID=6293 RepID=A0A1I8ECM1_WUCBA